MRTDPLEHRPLAVRRIDFLAGLQLDIANGQDMARAIIQQPDDFGVQLVNGFPMFRDTHVLGKMRN